MASEYDAYGQRITKPPVPPTHKTLVLTIDQWGILQEAWQTMKEQEGPDVTLGQKMELCCADWLSGN